MPQNSSQPPCPPSVAHNDPPPALSEPVTDRTGLATAEALEAARTAAGRIAELRRLFAQVATALDLKLAHLGQLNAESPKSAITKLGELQTMQVALLKAEEAFHDRYGKEDDECSDIDYDAIRDQVGRRLDRLRDARGTGEVSE